MSAKGSKRNRAAAGARDNTPAARSSSPGRSWPRLWRPVVIAIAAVAVYAGTLSAPFMFDDRPAIADNVELRQWPDVMRVLKSAPPETPLSGRPAVSLTFGLNYAISGDSVTGFRVGNLLMHIACALLLFAVARRMVTEPVAFAIALIWTVHPLNSEVVCYLSQRTDSAMACCLLLMLLASIRAHEPSRQTLWQGVAVAAAVVGMACKESMVVAPILVVLYDRIFVFTSLKDAFAASGRFYGALAASWIALLIVVLSTPRTFGAGFASLDPSVWTYLLNQSVIITRYLLLSVWPRSLVLFYGWSTPTTLAAVWPYVAWIAMLVLTTLVALWRKPKLGFLGAWFFITLAPTSSLAPIAGEVGAERRMYLALAAVIALCVIGARWLWQRLASRWTADVARVRGRVAGAAALGVIVVLLGLGTVMRGREYASALTMARTNYARWPSGAAASMLGTELIAAGYRTEAIRYLSDSALTYTPGQYALGHLLLEMGSYERALGELRAFIRAEPNLDLTRKAELLIAEALAGLERWPEAEDWLKKVVSKSPGRADAIGALADLYFYQGEFDGAITTYQTFLHFHPNHPEALANLAVAFASTGQLDEAVKVFRQVVSLQPANVQARLNLSRALLDRGHAADLDEAHRLAAAGASAMPHDAGAVALVGRALERRGDRAGARAAYDRALGIDAGHLPALEGLARIK